MTFKQTVKTIRADTKLMVHPLATKPYQIYCEYLDMNLMSPSSLPMSKKTPLFEVILVRSHYLFFEDFAQVSILGDKDLISVRRVNLTKVEIERRAWSWLFEAFISIEPINPDIYDVIKNTIPKHIENYLFAGILTIEQVLRHKNLKRYHFDYQRSKQPIHCHKLPSFADLIQQVRYDGH
ncbi:hypothetical protein [Psychrobacter arenosus]|uniref:hypothetical protein n=1 Tax=Psychrobacter arenosus TaxID=256326 RepID=UPI001917B3A2|nr:hypothetical protein [Psychrobacter arenosus]